MRDRKEDSLANPSYPAHTREKHAKNLLTVMIMRRVGRVRSFKVSPRTVLVVLILFLLYIPTSIFFINGYLSQRHTNDLHGQRIVQLKGELQELEKSLKKSKIQIARLETYREGLETQKVKESNPILVKNSQQSDRILTVDSPDESQQDVNAPNVVDIEEMRIKRNEEDLKINFKLVNKKTQDNPVSGYVHIIAVDKTESPPQEWAFPNIKLQTDFTLNFRHGLFFRIQRFKPINVNFDFTPDIERPSTIRVLAYDLKGALILEKEFAINDFS